MSRERTPPTPVSGNKDAHEHPSWALIRASRVSGGSNLFESDYKHHNYMTLSIFRAERCGSGSQSMVMGKNEYLEIAMTEAQFARLVASAGVGVGVPCTLQRHNGELIEEPEDIDTLAEVKENVECRLTDVMKAQLKIVMKLKEWREDGHRPTLKELDSLSQQMHLIAANFEINMGHYANCFGDYLEKMVDAAKTEIDVHRDGEDE